MGVTRLHCSRPLLVWLSSLASDQRGLYLAVASSAIVWLWPAAPLFGCGQQRHCLAVASSAIVWLWPAASLFGCGQQGLYLALASSVIVWLWPAASLFGCGQQRHYLALASSVIVCLWPLNPLSWGCSSTLMRVLKSRLLTCQTGLILAVVSKCFDKYFHDICEDYFLSLVLVSPFIGKHLRLHLHLHLAGVCIGRNFLWFENDKKYWNYELLNPETLNLKFQSSSSVDNLQPAIGLNSCS